jgi:phage RecT family recombinase
MANTPAIIKKTDDAKKFLAPFMDVIPDYATRDFNHAAFMKSAMMCIMESDELQKCMTTPAGQASLYHALRYAAGTGLSLNPQEGKAALIAYAGKVEYQVMKGGMIELAMASQKVEFITSDIVYEGDEFNIEKTMDGDTYRFKPALMDRGKVIGYFAALRMTDATVHVKWIDIVNMEKHRDQYGKGVKKENSAWNKSFDGMALKTVLKALLRSLEISPDLTGAVSTDDKFEAGDVLDITPDEAGTSAEDVKGEMEAAAESGAEGGTEDEKPDLF